MKISLMSAAAAVALVAGVASAQASCGDGFLNNKGHFIKMPIPPQSRETPAGASIVGMWRVQYSNSSGPLFQSLQQWHSDGTEFEFADIPTIEGDICMGVYSVGRKRVSLYHTAWTFDSNGNPNGTMVLTHKDQVASDGNSFTGQFDLTFYDNSGTQTGEMTGSLQGTRISAP